MLPKEELLRGIENREAATRIIDQADQAIRTWDVVMSDFLTPPDLFDAQQIFSRLTEIHMVDWGGYPQAERKRLAIARPDLPLDTAQVELAALSIAGNFLFDPATHRDFLGAILGTGIVREKLGDIIVLGERGAQVVVFLNSLSFLKCL